MSLSIPTLTIPPEHPRAFEQKNSRPRACIWYALSARAPGIHHITFAWAFGMKFLLTPGRIVRVGIERDINDTFSGILPVFCLTEL